MITSYRARFEDEKNGIDCQNWMNRSREICILGQNQSFASICIFLNGIFINVKSSLSSFQKCIGLLHFDFQFAGNEPSKRLKYAIFAESALFFAF